MHLNLQPQMSLQIYGDVTQVKSIHHISMKQISIKHQISSNMHINILWVIPSLYYIILYFIIPCVIPWYSHGFLSSHAHHLRHPPQVIVVGGGLAGMSAANTVVEHGGRTLLLDKSSFCGGTPPRLGVKVAKFVWDVWKIKIGWFLEDLWRILSEKYGKYRQEFRFLLGWGFCVWISGWLCLVANITVELFRQKL